MELIIDNYFLFRNTINNNIVTKMAMKIDSLFKVLL
jgi:hypothetical protein